MDETPEIPLIGYTDRLSGRPGETIEFKVSSTNSGPFEARLVRVISADPNPQGPGIIEEAVDADFAGGWPSRTQAFYPGSYGRIDGALNLEGTGSLRLSATIWPTAPGMGEQTVLALGELALTIGEDGALGGRAARGSVSLGTPLKGRTWYAVWLAYDASDETLSVGQIDLAHEHLGSTRTTASAHVGTLAPAGGAVAIAADLREGRARRHFNGKIEAPAIHAAATPDESALVARWDFSRGIPSTRIEDVGPRGLLGELVNLPARAMTGSNWDGSEMCWRHAPEQYGAIHFHDDDIYDFGWETDFAFTIPEGFPSGVYAARIACDGHEDAMPFFVCPPLGKRTAELCVLASTFTYTVYGNHARNDFKSEWLDGFKAWNAYPWNPARHRRYGLSTYNFHSDGSGICHASHRRPLFTLRPGYVTFGYGPGSRLRHFQADSHLISWLHAKGIGADIVTDRELHEDGPAALAGYRAVTTGSHPEYHTRETLDALEAYRDRGGNLLYLGGNGFYWRVALHKQEPGAIEIRRAEGGIRTWEAETGEYHNAFDGAYGGLWRRNARPPQKLAGVGFSVQGQFEGSFYRRRPESRDPAVAWIFEGIDEEIIGDFGLSGGGAAGFELDRADPRLGTPENAWILASSEGHGPSFIVVPEELLTHLANLPGEDDRDLLRADMVYFETPGGGAVFSTGSITFCGSLPHNDFDNNISRLLSNLLARFLASAAGPATLGSAGAPPPPQPSPVEGEGADARSAE